jgi:glutaredoxin 3
MEIKIYGTQDCHFCYKARELAANHGAEVEYFDIGGGTTLVEFGNLFPNCRTVPQIIVDGIHIGGYNSLKYFFENGEKVV